MSGGGLGLVKASRGGKFQEGDVVSGFVPWSTFFVVDAASQVCLHAGNVAMQAAVTSALIDRLAIFRLGLRVSAMRPTA